MKYFLLYLLVINVIAFFVYGIDKRKAKKDKYRIPEKYLFILAAIGGSIGAMGGMKVFRHKTLHASFKYGIPAILTVQIVVAMVVLYYL